MKSGIFKQYDPMETMRELSADQVRMLSSEEMDLYYVALSPGVYFPFLRDEQGNEWYKWLKTLSSETLKVSYAPETGEIIHFSFDASAIFPINQIVVEVKKETIPEDFKNAGDTALGGGFIYKDGGITAAPIDNVAVADIKRRKLLAEATATIAPLQDAVDLGVATDEEIASLRNWKKHRVLLSRVDISAAPNINWPVSSV
ncbi:tail fiber assembly protein [Buttiauxella sp. B2]|uniref:tail fiber assembly protein n=1 Tax=Buttiauxella sp. B2 TaxID=2587812 RepID=UPI001672FAF9|nr:tail fiber assembly protein [Buttiauxella sp. B2]